MTAHPAGAAARARLSAMPADELLARVLWGEDRGGGRIGMQAVACVIGNRVHADLGAAGRADWWGEGWQGVCLQPWQFSCVLEGDPNLQKLLAVTAADRAFGDALDIARSAVAGRLQDITGGADHYLVTSIIPRTRWARENPGKVTARIGSHTFFRLCLPASLLSVAPPATTLMLPLRRGGEGEAVELVQHALASFGFAPGPVDGDFGWRTDAAVRAFQAARGLSVDGVVGAVTARSLGLLPRAL